MHPCASYYLCTSCSPCTFVPHVVHAPHAIHAPHTAHAALVLYLSCVSGSLSPCNDTGRAPHAPHVPNAPHMPMLTCTVLNTSSAVWPLQPSEVRWDLTTTSSGAGLTTSSTVPQDWARRTTWFTYMGTHCSNLASITGEKRHISMLAYGEGKGKERGRYITCMDRQTAGQSSLCKGKEGESRTVGEVELEGGGGKLDTGRKASSILFSFYHRGGARKTPAGARPWNPSCNTGC